MAWTNWGFDGTINESQWAQMAGLLGNGYVAAGNGDCIVTAVPGARSVSVAAGTLYGDGIVSVNSGAETVAMTTPVNGQWYVIALRRTWATNTAALVAIAGATTTTTTPTAPPTSFPTLNTNVGVLTDQPIAWAWCNSANTDVVVVDLRQFPVRTQSSTGNVIINGAMEINQRNFTSNTTNGAYCFDRWLTSFSSGTVTTTPQTFTPGEVPTTTVEGKNYARVVISGQSGTSGYATFTQRIEGVRTLAGQTATLSFWAKASSGSLAIAAEARQDFGSGGSAAVNTLFNKFTLSTAWTRYTATVTIPSTSGKTIASEGGILQLQFWLSAGSDYASRTNTLGLQAGTFDIYGVQLEAGPVATPFKRAGGTLQGELAACQRYYYRQTATAPYSIFGYGNGMGSSSTEFGVSFPVTMRAIPTSMDSSNIGGGTPGVITLNPSNLSFQSGKSGTTIGSVSLTSTNNASSGSFVFLWANNTTSAYIGFNAEL